MRTEYHLFPDRREPVGGPDVLTGERPGDGHELLEWLHGYDWQHPLIVLFREGGDNRWSFTAINPRRGTDEEDGED